MKVFVLWPVLFIPCNVSLSAQTLFGLTRFGGSKNQGAIIKLTTGSNIYIAKYWKNGTPVILGNVSKDSKANAIFLVKK